MRPETWIFEQRKAGCRALQGDGGSALHGPSTLKAREGRRVTGRGISLCTVFQLADVRG